MNHIFCIHSSVLGHLGCFQLLAIRNKAAMNVVEHMLLWCGGASFGYIAKSGIAESSESSISNFLRNQQIDFQSGYNRTTHPNPLTFQEDKINAMAIDCIDNRPGTAAATLS